MDVSVTPSEDPAGAQDGAEDPGAAPAAVQAVLAQVRLSEDADGAASGAGEDEAGVAETASLTAAPPVAPTPARADEILGSPTLNKSVFALAIEPLTMALTVTGRKAYDVMLWLAQRSRPGAEGGYTSPVSAILKGYGSTTKASERVQRYIEQMVQTTVVWRPLSSAPAQPSLLADGEDVGAAPTAAGARGAGGDEVRTFPLLAEARLYLRGGEAWVTWFYPPSIREQLVHPERWAQLELSSIAKLTTYTAVALYEICARYKDSPGGLTSRHEPDFWSRVLREGGGVKPREFRKFKSELLVPAIAEIGEKTEIEVELVEHRGAAMVLEEVQFRVRRRAAPRDGDAMPPPADVALVMHAARLGVKETEVDALVARHGADAVVAGLERLEAQLHERAGERIGSPGAYLRAIVAGAETSSRSTPGGSTARAVPLEAVSAPHATAQPAQDAARRPAPPEAFAAADEAPRSLSRSPRARRGAASAPPRRHDAQHERRELVEAWLEAQWRAVRQEFAALAEDEQRLWVDRVASELTGSVLATPGVRRRLAEHQWESPLIRHLVLDAYATGGRGPGWREPSEIDLVLFAAERVRAESRGESAGSNKSV